jgi:exodeoxyribonuclease VII large subunit
VVAVSLSERARQSVSARLARASDDIAHTRARLVTLSPASTLRRGYAIVQRADGTVVRAAAGLAEGDVLTARFPDDHVIVRVTGTPD